ncbi:DUF2155 domain-containing protein [Sulfitobacter pacificus]|uniref:DUF2155 domain-containing protein n=1 Tax=Sulfitobacter pacificus TaxID=1499314 RepID=A0ABQ5VGR0_9RHOB|nr:hypothetical protein GCM10007927_10860 [Sulfitobacter pacificus]
MTTPMRSFLAVLVTLGGLAAAPLAAQEVSNAPGGVLRALDKTSGQTTDFEMRAGQAFRMGSLQIVMKECRYPAGNPSGNAYAGLEISENGKEGVLFSGWMIASAPALSALEHQRYDVWVIRCTTS